MAEIPPAFKPVTSAIRRAEEADKNVGDRDSAVLGYACRMSAISKATKLTTKQADETKFILSQLDLLENSKKSFNITEGDCINVVRQYGTMIFDKADEIDRNGFADKSTAKLFYAAVTYYDVLEFYGQLDSDLQEKRKYSKWKAAEILNACNSGVKPTPGAYGEMAHMENATPAPPQPPSLNSLNLQSPTAAASPTPQSPTPSYYSTTPSFQAQPQYAPAPTPSSQYYQPPPSTNYYNATPVQPQQNFFQPPTPAPVSNPGASRAPPLNNADPRVKDAVELCNFAISAIKHNELQLAKDRLQEALRRLG